MTNSAQVLMSVGNRVLRKMFFALAVVCTLTSVGLLKAHAQTFSVIHNFTGGTDGKNPFAALTVTPSGVLYGTAPGGGAYSAGTVFKLDQVNSTWIFSPLYEFPEASDGDAPQGGVVIGPNGALYGTTFAGGANNYGAVFELRPPATVCRSVTCYWNENVLYSFMGAPDGQFPEVENLAFDQVGNMYGTTLLGGLYDDGATFEVTPSGAESILHSFGSGSDGDQPWAGVVLDTAGNVCGTTPIGGTGGVGTVYQLVPSNGEWLENVLVNFNGTNGQSPYGNLSIDASGNLYGATYGNGLDEGGQVVFKLAPSEGGFTSSVLYSFSRACHTKSGVTMDAAGNFFGVCIAGGANQHGWVYELTNCSQTCTLVDLHDFSGSDGSSPWGTPALDVNGNLYGTTIYGGTVGGTLNCKGNGCGVVWEIARVGAPRKN